MENQACIFCRIAKGELPSNNVYEDKDLLAFMDIHPINRGHVLIIPKKHAELVSAVDEATLGKMMVLGVKIDSAIRKSKIKCEGISFLLADGEAAGQEIQHVHLHIIPRFKGDGSGLRFRGVDARQPGKTEFAETAKEIKALM
jgi:histidine triad (HIT) family protein